MTAAGIARRELLASSIALPLLTSSIVWPSFALAATDAGVTPFSYRAPQSALDDLKRRLANPRWPENETGSGWDQGPPLAALQNLVTYWRSTYDWRKTETRLNRWPQFRTEIDGLGIHFLHVRSKHPNALPIILTHGWSSTILLFQKVIDALVDPTAHGGTAADAFHVVIPSLPGFGFSDKPTARGWNASRTAQAWGFLMQRLGYDRYVAQGGDWGAFVSTMMAKQRAPGLAAIHLNFAQTTPAKIPAKLLPDQKRAVDAMKAFQEKSSAYFMLQATRPQLAGYLLADSPVAQAAWLYDLFNWGTGVTGNPDAIIPRDDMLDEITIYWLTNSAASSARFYLENSSTMASPVRVDLPVAVSVFPDDLPPARSWAPLVYPKLYYWNELSRGGHFAQFDVPDLFINEMRKAFQTIRMA
ncbi:multidrug MFS transporter [Polymorphobacter multimanifer]|uniref:Pimeloyl-ACP methyl ester carboxylesterase n=1 Tax=Polymorphobacter multimanifer TaxID=1070431 RepID=A0A841LJ64_9SPHN|nr:epoxide hydrolase [Polymorphobacter multimanifer]MBB6229262.1 pimeloyl-ACP methyl ester carboxylesterase [Polymorphobacter multimanifer]GGI85501.1 multidrug MFS transporter [Polymorphobacter multimanifer]